MSNYQDQMVQAANTFAENLKSLVPQAPEFKAKKSGFEIRAEVLGMAKQFTEFEYNAKLGNVDTQCKNGEFITSVNYPEVPGIDQVLKNAERFYSFITKK